MGVGTSSTGASRHHLCQLSTHCPRAAVQHHSKGVSSSSGIRTLSSSSVITCSGVPSRSLQTMRPCRGFQHKRWRDAGLLHEVGECNPNAQPNSMRGEEIHAAQQADKNIVKLVQAHTCSQRRPLGHEWSRQTLQYYRYCHGSYSRPTILPDCLHSQAHRSNHDVPQAGHQGAEKTLERLRQHRT